MSIMMATVLAFWVIAGLGFWVLKSLQKRNELRHVAAIEVLLAAQRRRTLRVLPLTKLLSSQWLREWGDPRGAFRYEVLYEDALREQYLAVFRVNLSGAVAIESEDDAPNWSRVK